MTAMPDVDVTVIEALDFAVPCTWSEIIGGQEPPCECEARWTVIWKPRCAHGSPVPRPTPDVVCDVHKDVLLRGRGMHCSACRCPIRNPEHLISAIRRLT